MGHPLGILVVTSARILMQCSSCGNNRLVQEDHGSARVQHLILSDLHLGTETSRAREATRVLKENRFERFILLGDIFADLNFARLTKEHWKSLAISGSSQIPNAILKWSGWKGTTTEPHALRHGGKRHTRFGTIDAV
jgi:hypothetical protein